METARTNGTTGKPEEGKNSTSPKKEGEEGKKATSPNRGEKDTNKNNASVETGQLKNSIYAGGDWKRPIIQFVESSDEKRSTYFNMESGESKKSNFPNVQLGEPRRAQVSFPERGDLRKSLFNMEPIASLRESGEAKRNNYNRPSRSPTSRPRILEEVLCDSCIDNKQKAVKSCLVCQASFCELHLKPHLEGAAFRDHQLLDPIKDFEARKCPVHGKTMELFCQTDQVCICYLCMFQEHKNHTTVTVEIEKSGKETELSLQKEQLQLKIIELEDEVDKWHKERDRIKNFTTNEKATVDQHFKELIRDLEKQRDEVKAGLDHREKVAVENIKEIVEELEERTKLLQEDKETREQISQISDSVLFLQFGKLEFNPEGHILLEGENMSPSMGMFSCMRHIEKICKADLSRNFIERNHMENDLPQPYRDHRFMINNYSDWNQPDSLKRFSMFLNPKGTKKSYHTLDIRTLSLSLALIGEYTELHARKAVEGNNLSCLLSSPAYPSIVRHQTASKAQPQTWKSSKQSMLSHYRPFYVNKGNGVTSNEAP
uniref:Tripartite motif-containing protein 29 n=1 Tax=Anolis carolinensis TaxID=28377 RepID=A0A803TS86_ANOCA